MYMYMRGPKVTSLAGLVAHNVCIGSTVVCAWQMRGSHANDSRIFCKRFANVLQMLRECSANAGNAGTCSIQVCIYTRNNENKQANLVVEFIEIKYNHVIDVGPTSSLLGPRPTTS
jgi:hypothetical protein